MKYRNSQLGLYAITLPMLIMVTSISACSDGSEGDNTVSATVGEGTTNTDGINENDGDDDAIQETTIADGRSLFRLKVTGEQQTPPLGLADASVHAHFTVDKTNGDISGIVSGDGLTSDAIGAHIHRGFAGNTGQVIVALEAFSQPPWVGAPDQPVQYQVPAGVGLDSDGLAALANGELYVNVHTTNHSDGEVRGQIIPSGVILEDAELTVAEVVNPEFTSEASGLGISTVNELTGAISATVFLSGIDDADSVEIRQGVVGSIGELVLVMEQDIDEVSVWRTPVASLLTDTQIVAFKTEALYFNVTSPRAPLGEIRGQL